MEKKDLTISMQLILEDSKEPHNIGDLGFILTVLRDNTSDDNVYEILNNILLNSKETYQENN